MYLQINEAVDSSKFADFFKSADIAVAFIKVHEIKKKKKTADELVFCLSLKTFWKDYFKIICQNFNVVLEKVHNIVFCWW